MIIGGEVEACVCVKDGKTQCGGEKINTAIRLSEDQANHFPLKAVEVNPVRLFVRAYRL